MPKLSEVTKGPANAETAQRVQSEMGTVSNVTGPDQPKGPKKAKQKLGKLKG